jgi:hypothetical protein
MDGDSFQWLEVDGITVSAVETEAVAQSNWERKEPKRTTGRQRRRCGLFVSAARPPAPELCSIPGSWHVFSSLKRIPAVTHMFT